MGKVFVSSTEDVMMAICQLHEYSMEHNNKPYSVSELFGFFSDANSKEEEANNSEFVIISNSEVSSCIELGQKLDYLDFLASELGKAPLTSKEIVNANIKYLSVYSGRAVASYAEVTDELKAATYSGFMKEYYGRETIEMLPDGNFKDFCLKYLNM